MIDLSMIVSKTLVEVFNRDVKRLSLVSLQELLGVIVCQSHAYLY